jgi:flagellar biosynthesis protein FliR
MFESFIDAEALEAIRQELFRQLNFTQVLLAFTLLLVRILPVIILTPVLGGETTPSEIRIGIGVLLGMVLFPVIANQVRNVPISVVYFVALLFKELFIGLSLVMIVGTVFDAAQMAGGFIDIMAGTNQAQLMVPMYREQVTLFSNLNLQLTVTFFLTLGGHHVVINSFAESLTAVPLDQYPRFTLGTWAYMEGVALAGDFFRISLALASPVLLATFLTDLALGMINRVAPQVQVFFVAMQIKPAVAVLIMFSAMHFVLQRTADEFGIMYAWLGRALRLLP